MVRVRIRIMISDSVILCYGRGNVGSSIKVRVRFSLHLWMGWRYISTIATY